MTENNGLFFDTISSIYDKMRPGYVNELYQDIFNYKAITSDSKVLEIGIGSGQATLPFLKKGCSITAVEPGEHFASMCLKKFSSYPNFRLENTDFLNFDGNGDSYDLIFSATAFHWIPEADGYQRVYSLLKPDGVFARFANSAGRDTDSELHQSLQTLYKEYMGSSEQKNISMNTIAKERAFIAKNYGFTNIVYHLYKRTRIFSSDEYLLLLETYPDHMLMEEKRRKEFFKEIKTVIDRFGGTITVYDTMDLELASKM